MKYARDVTGWKYMNCCWMRGGPLQIVIANEAHETLGREMPSIMYTLCLLTDSYDREEE